MYLDAVRRGLLPPGWLLDDGAGLVFRGRRLERVVTARPDAGAAVVDVDGVVPLRAELLLRSPSPLPAAAASEDVRELRALRQALAAPPLAGRRRRRGASPAATAGRRGRGARRG